MAHKSSSKGSHPGVHPETASDPSAVQNFYGYVQTFIPQSYSNQSEDLKQKLLWVKVDKLNILGVHHLGTEYEESKPPPSPLVVTLGYVNGFSVWTIAGGTGEGQEVYTQHTGGPVKVVSLLEIPEIGVEDCHADQRPLLAMVPKPFDTLVPVSLKTGQELDKKYHINFKRKNDSGVIVNVASNRKYVIVVMQLRITVLSAGDLHKVLFYIKNNYPVIEYPCNPISLGSCWLAYPDIKLNTHHQSHGGVYPEEGVSMKAKMLDAMKGVGKVASEVYNKYWKGEEVHREDQSPIVESSSAGCVITILDVERVLERFPDKDTGIHKVDLKDMNRESGVIAHFLAHRGDNLRLAALAFDPTGMLLLTACSEGRVFNLFCIHPHPWLSSETCVQHLYSLRRGDTRGLVQGFCFSSDSRWAAISTLHGTTHIFPITPYGGAATKRTHLSSRVVNRSGRFHITAGLTAHSTSVNQPDIAYSSDMDQFASLQNFSNPHVASVLQKPLEIHPSLQIKQPVMSLITLEDEATGSSPKMNRKGKSPALIYPVDTLQGHLGIVCAATFASSRGTWKEPSHGQSKKQEPQKSDAVDSLYIIGGNGVLTEHVLSPHVAKDAKGKDDRCIKNAPDDAPIELEAAPRLSWNLIRQLSPASNYVIQKEYNLCVSQYDSYIEHPQSSTPSSPGLSEQWLAHVEVCTHEEPPRRLWMGPQFQFKTYEVLENSRKKQDTEDNSFQSAYEGEHEVESSIQSAILHTTTEEDSLLQERCNLTSIASSPMMIPRDHHNKQEENFIDNGPPSLGATVDTVEYYGSWKDSIPKNGVLPPNITQQLEDAMRESPSFPKKVLQKRNSSPEEEFDDAKDNLPLP